MGKYTEKDFSRFKGQVVEAVPLASENKSILKHFRTMYRAPFGSNTTRWYFAKGENEFYSGLTGAISKFGGADFTALNNKRKELAFEGVDADELWSERANYGSCCHLLIALHERKELPFSFDSPDWIEVAEDFIQTYGYQMVRRRWIDDLQNDMAAWFRFKQEYSAEVLATEIMVSNKNWKIATPLDIIARIDFNGGRIIANLNWKTGDKPFGEEYYKQAAMEAYMYNQLMIDPKYKLEGSFCLRPKARDRSPGNYELSKNCINLYETELFEFIGRGVNLFGTHKPSGMVKEFKGDEKKFTARIVTPYEWLKEFNDESPEFNL